MTQKIHIKFKVKGYPLIVIDKNDVVWQLPYHNKGNNYGYRIKKLKSHLGRPYYQINRKHISKRKLIELAYIHNEVIDTGILIDKHKPFK